MASCIGRRTRLVFPASKLGSSWFTGQEEEQEPDRREFPTSLRHKLLFSMQSPLSSSCQPCVAPAAAPQADLKSKKVFPREIAFKKSGGQLKKNEVKFCKLADRINDDGGQMTKTKLMTVEMVRERWVVAPSSWRRGATVINLTVSNVGNNLTSCTQH